MSIADERYVRLTTWTRDGRPRHVPVWIVGLGGGRVGFTTGSGSWKVRRLRHDPAVQLRASDMDGTVTGGSTAVSGTAEVVDGDAYLEVRTAIRRKYGIQYVGVWLASAVGRLRGRNPTGDRAVIVTLD
jgi:PPOX class probable F420-dependent enzyme